MWTHIAKTPKEDTNFSPGYNEGKLGCHGLNGAPRLSSEQVTLADFHFGNGPVSEGVVVGELRSFLPAGKFHGRLRSLAEPASLHVVLSITCLLLLPRGIMPRRQKSRGRSGHKRRQAQEAADAKSVESDQDTEVGEENLSAPMPFPFEESPPGSPEDRGPRVPQESLPCTVAAEEASCPKAADHSLTQTQGEGDASAPVAGPSSALGSQRDPIGRRFNILIQLLLHKHKMKEPVSKADMMKVINKKYQQHYPEMLKKASLHMWMVFGLEMKEVDSQSQTYVLVSVLEISREERLFNPRGFPRMGLLMPVLGLIYRNGYQIREETMWGFLNSLGIFDGKCHFIFGEPRKLLTRDLVQEKYLEYRKVPNSEPPCYEFLWGARAHAEANKEKVLEFLEKLDEIDTKAFRDLYERTWRDEEMRVATSGWGGTGLNARARARFRAKSSKAIKAKQASQASPQPTTSLAALGSLASVPPAAHPASSALPPNEA
ncbi:melanoma-associated antigen B1-like [Tenrec ecaudatus]|uniref:melanoma-associated antigen B1-like n=1 Tax=Tenrec ecaudatus TaxID=94439 RepID=UPI003F59E324